VPEKEAKSSIQVIERMMRLLAALGHHPSPVNLKQLATETRLHPSTAHRILSVMVEHRLVDRIEPGTYRLGIRLLELGSLVRSRISVRQEALHHMQTLHEELGETVNLSVRHDDEVVYIERASDNNSMMRVVQIIGARAPLHITAVGKLFLAEEGPEGSADYARRTGLPKFTDNTLTDSESLVRELEKIRRLGYAFDNEEAEKGVSCIGAGIYNDEGKLVAGLSVSAPSDRLNHAWAAQVRQTAETISRAIGYQAATGNR
jgi:DNA-binding IclR family transcriptional regulator